MAHIRIVDLPCGYGKSLRILRSFDKRQKYIAVVPYLSEVDRFIKDAYARSGFCLTQPVAGTTHKRDHCEKLILAGKSIACTHALFYRLGTLATRPTEEIAEVQFNGKDAPVIRTKHILDDYNLIIDEVVNPFESEKTVRPVDFDEDYVGLGMATVHKDGRVEPTPLWDKRYAQNNKTFNPALYEKAKSGALYKLSEGLFILTIPMELLLKPKTVTIYTYLSEGSVLLQFLRRLKEQQPDAFTLEVEKLDPASEAEWRADVAQALTVKSIPDLEPVKWNYTAQLKDIKTHKQCASVGHALKKLGNTELLGVKKNTVMLTCARALWFSSKSGEKPVAGKLSKHTRLFGRPLCSETYNEEHGTFVKEWSTDGVRFVPNTTRGTNDHIKCATALYLYDQHPEPQLVTFLGMKRNSPEGLRFADAYALTELIQWLFRSAIRRDGINGTGQAHRPRGRVTVYIPSARMRNLLQNWLATGKVSSATPRAKTAMDAARRSKPGFGKLEAA